MQKTYYTIQVTNTLGSVAYITGGITPTEAGFPQVVMSPTDERALKFDSDNSDDIKKWLKWTYEKTTASKKVTSITTKKIEMEKDVQKMEAVELLEHDFEEAYQELSQSYTLDEMVYSAEHVKTYYNERSEEVRAFEGSWKFEDDNEGQMRLLIQLLLL